MKEFIKIAIIFIQILVPIWHVKIIYKVLNLNAIDVLYWNFKSPCHVIEVW